VEEETFRTGTDTQDYMRNNFIKNTRLKTTGQWKNSELEDDLRKRFHETMQLEMLSLTSSVITLILEC
jgi:hypothetical protein